MNDSNNFDNIDSGLWNTTSGPNLRDETDITGMDMASVNEYVLS